MYNKPDELEILLMDKLFAFLYEYRGRSTNFTFIAESLSMDYKKYKGIHDLICEYGVKEGFIKMDAEIPTVIFEIDERIGQRFIDRGGFDAYFKAQDKLNEPPTPSTSFYNSGNITIGNHNQSSISSNIVHNTNPPKPKKATIAQIMKWALLAIGGIASIIAIIQYFNH